MKVVKNSKNLSGSALLITIVTTGILTMAMASYLALVSSQYRFTVRSQGWNSAIPVTEAGIEESLAHLNKNCMTNGINVNPYDPSNDGWVSIGSDNYQKERVLSDGSRFLATVCLTNPLKPGIFSEGFAPASVVALRPKALFAAVGANEVKTNAPLFRNVRVTTRIIPVFTHALAAKDTINLNGNNVTTDSFNSTNGAYASSSRNDNGDIATNSSVKDDLKIGNANIRGKVSIGPGGTEPEIGNNGVVGSNEFVDGGGEGIEEGYWNDDMNVEFEDVEPPFGSGNRSVTSPYTSQVISNTFSTNIINSCPCSGGNNCCVPTGTGGTVVANLEQQTGAGIPSNGSYVGDVKTNWVPKTSAAYPSGSNIRNIEPITEGVSSQPYAYPAAGTFVGTVSSTIVDAPKTKTQPSVGAYEPGTLDKQGAWYYYKVKTYQYQKLTGGYTYEQLSTYTYAAIIGYRREVVTSISTTNSVTFDHAFLSDGNYKVSSLSGKILVAANAVVYCTGGFTASMLYIQPGGSIRLYVGGDVDFSGNQKVNEDGLAKNMSIYGLPTCKNISISGNAEFVGTIYAPQAHLQVNGGGSDTKDFFGSAIVGSAQLNGHANFHFDEDLKNSGPSRGYIANSWREE